MKNSDSITIERELRRIGVDLDLFSGLAATPALSYQDVLTWLRRLPTGLGHRAFMERLRNAGPVPGLGNASVPPPDPAFAARDLDLRETFDKEFDRVLPPDMRPRSWLITELDLAAVVPALRRLPDRAGWKAVQAVLPIAEVQETPDA